MSEHITHRLTVGVVTIINIISFIKAVGVLTGSNTYKIGGDTKIKNFQDEEVMAACKIDEDKLILTMTGGKAGTVQITRLVKDDKLHVEQVDACFFVIT